MACTWLRLLGPSQDEMSSRVGRALGRPQARFLLMGGIAFGAFSLAELLSGARPSLPPPRCCCIALLLLCVLLLCRLLLGFLLLCALLPLCFLLLLSDLLLLR